MKHQKFSIKQIVLLMTAVVIAVPLFSGCATENRMDYPFERAQVRAKEQAETVGKDDALHKYRNDVVITDGDIVGFAAELIEILGKQEKNYRIIRKVSTTLGVLAGTIATSIHGAIGADADTVSMFSAGAVLTPLLQQIWGAGEASQAKRKGINLISNAQSRYYNSISVGNSGGKVNNDRITTAGATLYNEVMAALTVVGNAIAKQIPSLKDLQTAEGVNALGMASNQFALKIVPRTIKMSKSIAAVPAAGAVPAKPAVPSIRYISIVGDLAQTADSDNPNIADVTGFTPGAKQIAIQADAVNDGVTTINISNSKGDSANVFVKVGNRRPTASAGSNFTVNKGDPVILSASNSSDPDGDTLTYLWALAPLGKVTLNDPASVNPTFIADKTTGSYTATVTVSDGSDSDTKSVTITAQ